jgi:hypothetical protein
MENLKSKVVLGLLLGLVVIVGLALAADLAKVVDAVREFEWGWLPMILGLTSFNYLLRFGKWHYYLHQVGLRNISRADSQVFLGGFSMTVTPGKFVDAVKQHQTAGHGPACGCERRCASSLFLWYHLAR